jgi:hypothetical protein
MNPTMRNPNAVQPAYPDFTNGSDNRNPISYAKALEQFDVEHNPRYSQRDSNGDGKVDTFCNKFLADGSRALGCEIPAILFSYSRANDGTIVLLGKELSANGMAEWFASKKDELAGWHEVNASDAILRANDGFPTVVIWNNPGGTGHVAWVLPSPVDGPMQVAQAGSTNFFNGPIRKGFGNAQGLKFYTHD